MTHESLKYKLKEVGASITRREKGRERATFVVKQQAYGHTLIALSKRLEPMQSIVGREVEFLQLIHIKHPIAVVIPAGQTAIILKSITVPKSKLYVEVLSENELSIKCWVDLDAVKIK